MLTASLRLAAESGADKENDLVIRLDSFCIKSHMVACRRAVTTSGHLRGLVGLAQALQVRLRRAERLSDELVRNTAKRHRISGTILIHRNGNSNRAHGDGELATRPLGKNPPRESEST